MGSFDAYHGWIELVDENGISKSFGAQKNKIRDDDHPSKYKQVVSYSFEIDSTTREKIYNHMKNKTKGFQYSLTKNNCICLVSEAMDLADIPHPDFKGVGGVPNPSQLRNYITLLNDGLQYEDMCELYEYRKQHGTTPIGTYSSLTKPQKCTLCQLNYGGVSFNKTAQLMLNLDDIAGAAFDETTQQIIFYGKKNVSLPKMSFDDLAVAFKSVYGLGDLQKQNPGVSIGEHADKPDMLKVRYDGQTFGTHFGLSMYESDRILKSLIMGIDNLTGKPINVPCAAL